MNILNVENVTKSYSEKMLLKDVSLGINDGDKIGVIGVNGTGKSTFLKIIAGVEEADQGKTIKNNSASIEYLSQNPDFDEEATVLEQIFSGNSPIMMAIKEYEKSLASGDDHKIIALSQKMDELNAWNMETEAKNVLTKLGITDYTAKVGKLSGGQRKRIALAAALIKSSDLLILDEPTNHLDNETIDWLEQYLNKRNGALLMITHDRYFLDRVVNNIIELDEGNLYRYSGNYSLFLEKKAEREDIEATNEKKRLSLFKKELAWIRRGAKARSTKQKARIDRFEALSQQGNAASEEKLDISLEGSRLGKKIIELKHISKYYEGKTILEDFDYIVLRNDRIGIVGPNGIGKSTLMNIIADKIKPEKGEVEIGETVKIGMYSQENTSMDEKLRVIEYVREVAEWITDAEGEKISASKMLERFLFPPEMQWTTIGKLSGGEKRRLYLLRVLMSAPNVLLMDEPTNDLDIQTLTILEDYIDSFNGAVITVSHDRYFLDRIADKIFAFHGNGKVTIHNGNYSDFKEDIKAVEESIGFEDKNRKNVDKNKEPVDKKKEKALKFSYKEQREYEEIDSVIEKIENEIAEVEAKIEEAASDYSALQQLLLEKENLKQSLDQTMERWVYLNELAEKIENQKK
ncbi:ABC-F family ATP-binding cassette domain-containing protein [Clostridium sp. 19966]|uniref:ABC-F family ATP-binding cassette domain-containing protein n=1 Tax=Clostridium sp. 19966 TaxID=2768166 RepID=UPI0028E02CD1|nr:ABC-F family ATP-binding cassette domain-containing protein [Clostridium sp. 19966]MDT8717570.1 ABC-F family ATP-binding cassette domain-containing protein [Clostridium sp. 19966]